MNGLVRTFWAAVSALCLAWSKHLLDRSILWKRRHKDAERKAKE